MSKKQPGPADQPAVPVDAPEEASTVPAEALNTVHAETVEDSAKLPPVTCVALVDLPALGARAGSVVTGPAVLLEPYVAELQADAAPAAIDAARAEGPRKSNWTEHKGTP